MSIESFKTIQINEKFETSLSWILLMKLHSASQARLYKVFMNLRRKFDDMKQ